MTKEDFVKAKMIQARIDKLKEEKDILWDRIGKATIFKCFKKRFKLASRYENIEAFTLTTQDIRTLIEVRAEKIKELEKELAEV